MAKDAGREWNKTILTEALQLVNAARIDETGDSDEQLLLRVESRLYQRLDPVGWSHVYGEEFHWEG